MSTKSKKSETSGETITIPVMTKNNKKFFLLNCYDDNWTFKAFGIRKKDPEDDPCGHRVKKVWGKGGVKCTPQNDYVLEHGDVKFSVIELPISIVDGKKYVKLSRLVDTWSFTAKTIDVTREQYKGSGHGHGQAQGDTYVKCSPQKTWNIKDIEL